MLRDEGLGNIDDSLASVENDIEECEIDRASCKVADFIAEVITRKLKKSTQCAPCLILLSTSGSKNTENNLTRGELTVPCEALREHVCHCFACLDFLKESLKNMSGNTRQAAEYILYKTCSSNAVFTCSSHKEWGFQRTNRILYFFSTMRRH